MSILELEYILWLQIDNKTNVYNYYTMEETKQNRYN